MVAINEYTLNRKGACTAGKRWFGMNTRSTDHELDLELLYSVEDSDVSWFWGVVLTMTPVSILCWATNYGIIPTPEWLGCTIEPSAESHEDFFEVRLFHTHNSYEFSRICEEGTRFSRWEKATDIPF